MEARSARPEGDVAGYVDGERDGAAQVRVPGGKLWLQGRVGPEEIREGTRGAAWCPPSSWGAHLTHPAVSVCQARKLKKFVGTIRKEYTKMMKSKDELERCVGAAMPHAWAQPPRAHGVRCVAHACLLHAVCFASQMGTAMWVIDVLALRVGNEKDDVSDTAAAPPPCLALVVVNLCRLSRRPCRTRRTRSAAARCVWSTWRSATSPSRSTSWARTPCGTLRRST